VATKSTTQDTTDAARQTVDRIRELNERIIDSARKAGSSYLDVYERTLGTIAGYQEEVANATPVDWLQRVIEAQAAFTRDIGNMYASTARELMKQQ
jgi:hypothetical protein